MYTFLIAKKVLEISILEGGGSHIQSVIQEDAARIFVHKSLCSPIRKEARNVSERVVCFTAASNSDLFQESESTGKVSVNDIRRDQEASSQLVRELFHWNINQSTKSLKGFTGNGCKDQGSLEKSEQVAQVGRTAV